jgi:hypothetical protein
MSRTWERRIGNLEANGHHVPEKTIKYVVTVQDLDQLYDLIFHGVPLPPGRERDPALDAECDRLYDAILENQRREGRAC